MFQLAITNLEVPETSFQIPSALGVWEFVRAPNYDAVLQNVQNGMCAHTYFEGNNQIDRQTRDADFTIALDEIKDICLVLSFLNARCVTPTGTTAFSQPQFIAGGGSFISARAISGFDTINTSSLTALFSNWLTIGYANYRHRQLRLQLAHWLSGLTCFSLEDIYLSAGVQMDVIRQVERVVTSTRNLNYFQGMQSAARRYSLTALGKEYKDMRNDIVHEGRLTGSNFWQKSKTECADVIASTLNWLDLYILHVLSVPHLVSNIPRWKGVILANALPAFSIP